MEPPAPLLTVLPKVMNTLTGSSKCSRYRCYECKRRKKKCDCTRPRCHNCAKRGVRCVYPELRIVHFQKSVPSPPVQISLIGRYQSFISKLPLGLFLNDFQKTEYINPVLHLGNGRSLSLFNEKTLVHERLDAATCIASCVRVLGLAREDLAYGCLMFNVVKGYLNTELVRFLLDDTTAQPVENANSESGSDFDSQLGSDDSTGSSSQFVDLTVRFENIKNVLYIQSPAVPLHDFKLINLPSFVDNRMACALFHHFCDLSNFCQGQSTTQVPWLKVCLPLILGNVTVLKSALLYSAHYIRQHQQTIGGNMQISDSFLIELESDVLHDVKDRLGYISSVCCDHNLMTLVLLLSVEVLKAQSGELWLKLMRTTVDCISMRGGPSELSKSVTGLCIMQIFSQHYFTAGRFRALAPAWELSSSYEIQFYDNINYFSNLGFNAWFPIMQLYDRISNIYYEESDSTWVMLRAQSLEVDAVAPQVDNVRELPLEISRLCARLFVYQALYRRSSLHEDTLHLVKLLLTKVRRLFTFYLQAHPSEPVLVLPFLILGVDVVDRNRVWYIDQLNAVYDRSHKQQLKVLMGVLCDIWARNDNGKVYVDWLQYTDNSGTPIPMYV
uniref:ARAD1C00198p n=1 Tax=Blastobotrys adeninivorans TaxID=409370 RepID=A0A060T4S6_BLAAD